MPKGISRHDVFEAADALLARGERPTIERVRREIGRGSPNTVNPLLDAWWQSLSERFKGEGEQDGQLPQALLASLEELYEKLQRSAVQDAEARIAERKQALDEREAELTRNSQELDAKDLALKAPLETLNQQLTTQAQANKAQIAAERELRKALAEAQADSRRLSTLLAKSEQEREKQRDRYVQELDRLHSRAEGQERHWLGEIDQLRQDLKEQRSMAKTNEKSAQKRILSLDERLTESRNSEREAVKELRALRKELSREQQIRARLETKLQQKRPAKQSRKKATRHPGTAVRGRRNTSKSP